jgi:hypothetical protein
VAKKTRPKKKATDATPGFGRAVVDEVDVRCGAMIAPDPGSPFEGSACSFGEWMTWIGGLGSVCRSGLQVRG